MRTTWKGKKALFVAVFCLAAALLAVWGLSLRARQNRYDPEEQLLLGQSYLSQLDYENAILVFEQVLTVEPKNVAAYLGLAEAYAGKGDLQAAVEVLRRGLGETDDGALRALLADYTERLRPASEPEANSEPEPAPGQLYSDGQRQALLRLLELARAGDHPGFFSQLGTGELLREFEGYPPRNDLGDLGLYYREEENTGPCLTVSILPGEHRQGQGLPPYWIHCGYYADGDFSDGEAVFYRYAYGGPDSDAIRRSVAQGVLQNGALNGPVRILDEGPRWTATQYDGRVTEGVYTHTLQGSAVNNHWIGEVLSVEDNGAGEVREETRQYDGNGSWTDSGGGVVSYNPDVDAYVEQDFYIPDPEP